MVKVLGNSPAGLTWCLHTLVVVRVYTHFVLLHVEGKLAQVYGTQLMVGLQVRPAPQSAVDHVREAFSMRYLQTAIQRPAEIVQKEIKQLIPYPISDTCARMQQIESIINLDLVRSLKGLHWVNPRGQCLAS